MEENSEAHMETDVSSTTEDVPQSHGNVETIIVVEEIKEEQDEKSGKHRSCNDNNEPQSFIESSNNVASIQTVVLESAIVEPEQSVQSSPSEPSESQDMPQTPSVSDALEQPILSNQTEIVDSSSKLESPKQQYENNIFEKPKKTYEGKKNEQKSHVKESKLEEKLETTQNDLNTMGKQTKQDETVKSNNIVMPVDVTLEREICIDSHMETNTDSLEKEHKGISRELKSLINSAKESKIISECTQLTTKTRKSRTILDSSNTSLNSSIEADKIPGVRRNSSNSQKSSCSEKSDKNIFKRSMRSQNPEFVHKVKQFLNSVTGKSQKDDDITDDDFEDGKSHHKEEHRAQVSSSTPKKRKMEEINISTTGKLLKDPFCWRCHWAVEQASEKIHAPKACTVCPRTFHFKCLSIAERNKINSDNSWVCPECLNTIHAESSETRSPVMKKIPLGMLCELLNFALERMMDLNGVEPFMNPVDREEFPDYDRYVVRPMDLSLMKSNIEAGFYGSTEAFMADAQWILHNSIIFNTLQSKLTSGARALVRSCRAEMGEIEACPECYAAAHARRPTWFTDVCSTPHILLWAKLKGFPYWPAKGMSVSSAGHVDVRFFGAHDRAWVPAKDCFLFSQRDPNNFRTKRQDLLDSMQEAEQHIRNISSKYKNFVYPPFKTQFDPSKLYEQLKVMIPSYEGEVQGLNIKEKTSNSSPGSGKDNSRSNNSKSFKSSFNDGEMSDAEDQSLLSTSNTVDKSDAATQNISVTLEKEKSIDVEMGQNKEHTTARKRRRSELEEAVITILDSATTEKRKRNYKTKDKTTDSQEQPSSSKVVPEVSKVRTDITKDSKKNNTEVKTREKPTATEEEPSSSSGVKGTINQKKETARQSRSVTPIKIKIQSKSNRHTIKAEKRSKSFSSDKIFKVYKTITPKESKVTLQRYKSKSNKSLNECNKDENQKSSLQQSKSVRSLSNISGKSDKSLEKSEKSGEIHNTKNKSKNNSVKSKPTESDKDKKNAASSGTNNEETAANALIIDDNTTIAALARESNKNVVTNEVSLLPTISSVRSLSTVSQNSNAPETSTSTSSKSIEVTIEVDPDSSIFAATRTDVVRNADDAPNRQQTLRNEKTPMVGRVGVRAFARMKTPDKQTVDNMPLEIKSEQIDLDEPERHVEKMDLMKAFKLRPVNPTGLRDVRLNRVVVTPLSRRAPATPELRPRAKKTFPLPKKPEDCQLNGKNSMVYIPIQPPMTQAPVRMPRPVNPLGAAANAQSSRPPAPVSSASVMTSMSSPLPAVTSAPSVALPATPTIGPAAVHTVPLMTSVNGQWMFSLQPVMSLGSVDSTPSQPIVNGLSDRVMSNAMLSSPSAINRSATEVSAPGEPPRLQQRPLLNPLDPSTPVATMPTPSTAGSLTAKLNQNASKLADFFRTLLEDSLEKLDDPAAQAASLRLQLEQCKWKHQKQLEEISHNHNLTMSEMRASLERDKVRAVNEARRAAQVELEAAVKLTKSKQWCAYCTQEAQFYCCWNTSYCDYPCQRAHWAQHFSACTQKKSQDALVTNNNGTNQSENILQTDNLPKRSVVPALTVGGKVASRPAAHEQPVRSDAVTSQKSSIIMTMIEDKSGNKALKCMGSYSSMQKQTPPAQVPPLILNKQLMNDETSKKVVVTSGGYLIVGSGASNQSVVSQPRRMHTIQYHT